MVQDFCPLVTPTSGGFRLKIFFANNFQIQFIAKTLKIWIIKYVKTVLVTSHVDDVMILQIQEAILDYTRVIHMRPDISDYHMARVSAHLMGSEKKAIS